MVQRGTVMPTYDYKCEECGETKTKMAPMVERNNQYCVCGNPLKIVIGVVAVLNANSGGRNNIPSWDD